MPSRNQNIDLVVWSFLAFSSLVTAGQPLIFWVFTAVLLVRLLLFAQIQTTEFGIPDRIWVCSASLIIMLLIVAGVRSQTIYNLGQAAKLTTILLIALPLFTRTAARRDALWLGSEIALYANAAAIVGGVTVFPGLFGLQGFARFGTIFAGPGSLWRIGAIGVAAAVRIGRLGGRHANLRRIVCLTISIVLVAVDGSRTGLIVGSLALIAGLFKLLHLLWRRPFLAIAMCGGLTATAAVTYVSPTVNEAVETYGVIARIQDKINSSGTGGVSAEDMDFTRKAMLDDVVAAIADHPLVGSGMGTTRTQTEVGPMVVHFSYLQVWGDIGLPGFLAYTLLLLSALWLALKAGVRAWSEGLVFPWHAAYLSAGWLLTGFFHPISTEFTEWIWFILAIALVADYSDVARNTLRRKKRLNSPMEQA